MFRKLIYFRCPTCSEGRIPSTNLMPLCDSCIDKLEMATHFCVKCGYPIDDVGFACNRCTTAMSKRIKSIYSSYKYNDIMRMLMISIKFDYNFTHAILLDKLIVLPKIDFGAYEAIVPMPSHILRAFSRFFHPADIIAHHIGKVYDIKIDYALRRDRNTPLQSLQSRKDREKNVEGAFSYSSEESYKRVLLVDDIITTGSSIDECAKVLKSRGVKRVDCYSLCYS